MNLPAYGTLGAVLFLAGLAPVRAEAKPVQRLSPQERSQGYTNHSLLAKPRAGAVERDLAAAEQIEGRTLYRRFPRLGNLRLLGPAPGETIRDALARLRASGRYDYVEPDYLRSRHALPDDPRFLNGEQWSLRNTGQQNGIAGADIQAVAAWDLRSTAPDTIVAVIDTGIRATHEDLAANLWTNPRELPGNGLDDDANGYVDDVHGINSLAALNSAASGDPDDDHGHGTLVAGAIGAVGNNGLGITGVAWKVKLMALKFDDAEGSATTSNEIECIDYALAQGARILNISFGGGAYSQAEFDALVRARDAGAIVVISAGNDAFSNDLLPVYPAGYLVDNVLSVAATDRRDALSDFSNFGAGAVDLAAPGTALTLPDAASNTAYDTVDGTSFSAPLVAGALALLRAQFPADDYRALINRLLRSVDHPAGLAGKVQTDGRLNVARALAAPTDRPFNDDFATRAALGGPVVSLRFNTRHATSEPGEPGHASLPADATLWWTWTAPITGLVGVETGATGFDSVVAIYTGASLATLTPVAANDDTPGSTASRAAFNALAGTTYQIAVGGKGGATGPAVLSLGFLPPNDAFTDAAPLSGQSLRATGFNTLALSEAGEPAAAPGARGHTVWYRWVAPASTDTSVSVFSFGFDAVATIYTGATLGTLTPVATASREAFNEVAFFTAAAGTTYYFQIDSADGNVGFFDLAVVDAIPLEGIFPVASSPAFSPTASTVYAADVFGGVFGVKETTGDFVFSLLDGTLDVQSPVIGTDGTVFIGDEFGLFSAFDPDLELRWRKDLGFARVTSSAALAADGSTYVHTDDGFLHAFLPDGATKWRAGVPGQSYSSPSIDPDGTLYLGSTDEHLYALRPFDGSLRWKFKADGEIYSSPAIDDAGNLYFGTLNHKFYSVTAAGDLRWVFSADGSISSSPALGADGTIYFGSYDTHLYALRPDGTLRWRYATGDEIRASSPAVASDGTIYIGSYDGFVHAVNANGTLRRVYATGALIRSSPLIHDRFLFIGSGDTRVYITNIGLDPASSPWPMFRQNERRTGRRALATAPDLRAQTTLSTFPVGGAITLAVEAIGADPLTFQWLFNGTPIDGATQPAYTLPAGGTAQSGTYAVTIANHLGTTTSEPIIVGLTTAEKVVGAGSEVGRNILHPNGNIFDQVLLEGAAAAVTADPGQVLRLSYIDDNDDIVQVEFSGAGSLSLVLDGPVAPAGPPAKYNQAVNYVKGRASLVVVEADETTNLSVFSVGRATAVNQALFRDTETYDGRADLASISIASRNGQFGGVRTANTIFSATKGFTGLYAPGVTFRGPVFLGDLHAAGSAIPEIILGSAADVRITGGDLLQTNARPVRVSGITQLRFVDGSTSHGTLLQARPNQARLEERGVDVTTRIVVNP